MTRFISEDLEELVEGRIAVVPPSLFKDKKGLTMMNIMWEILDGLL